LSFGYFLLLAFIQTDVKEGKKERKSRKLFSSSEDDDDYLPEKSIHGLTIVEYAANRSLSVRETPSDQKPTVERPFRPPATSHPGTSDNLQAGAIRPWVRLFPARSDDWHVRYVRLHGWTLIGLPWTTKGPG
jgi:hypothetical protein